MPGRSRRTAAALAGLLALVYLLPGHADVHNPALTAPGTADGGPLLTIGDVRYRGAHVENGDIEAFRGIPFAAPPVGDLRWRPPAPLALPTGERNATRFAPVCLQGTYMSDWYRGVVAGFGGDPATIENPPESEDCLYLNLWRPAHRDGEALPLIVYIHGGGNSGGWSWEPNYLGARLASEGFVVVTTTYRLGAFGFFAHPGQPEANFGLLDQVAALRWLQTHAATIGADPDRVTVVGESAGGNNIISLLASPLARGLFQRAAVQSAGWSLQEMPRKAEHDALGLALQHAVVGEAAGLEALRHAPAPAVFAAIQRIYTSHGFDPVVDGHSLVEAPVETFNRGAFPSVDLLIGSNRDEWKMYLDADATLDDWAEQGLPAEARGDSEKLLAAEDDKLRALDRAVTAWNMVCPSLHLAEAMAGAGGRSWVYWFTRVRPGAMAEGMGAYHGAELPYVFDTHDAWLPTDDIDRALTRAVMTYWSHFARTGDPNGPERNGATVFPWPTYRQAGDPVLRLDAPPEAMPHPERALCRALGVRGQQQAPRP